MCDDYLKLARKYKIATVFADAPDFPSYADVTGDFVYARLLNAQSARITGYTKPALKQWAEAARQWQQGAVPLTLPHVGTPKESNKPRDIQAKNNQVKAGQERIDRMKADAGNKLKEDNPHVPHVKAAESRVLDTEAKLVTKQGEIDALAGEVQTLEDIVKVFSPAGVRAHILDSITPFLNDRTRDYLGALSDGNSHAVWSTLTKTAKGELKEKFNIEVTNDLGGDTFAALSGGEKRKVRLATAMALQEMVASRATKPINLFIADEIDHALDESGLERLMGILDKRAKAQGTVLVISHNALADWVPDVITVEKTGKVSTLSGATHKTF